MDHRPMNCRQRLMDEGKPYPRSSCGVCGSILTSSWRCRDEELRPSSYVIAGSPMPLTGDFASTRAEGMEPQNIVEQSLFNELRAARLAYEVAGNEYNAAGRRRTEALNALNEVQKKIDTLLAALKEGAERDSDWGRSRQVGVVDAFNGGRGP